MATASLGRVRTAELHPALQPFRRHASNGHAQPELSSQAGSSSHLASSSPSRGPLHPLSSHAAEYSEDDEDFEFEYEAEAVDQEYARPASGSSRPAPTEPASGIATSTASDSNNHNNNNNKNGGTTYPPPPPSLNTATPAPPQAPDQPLHDALSSELLRLSTVLKSNALAFGAALERDRLLLAKSSDHLGANLDFMTRTRGRLGEYSRRARGMGWFTFGSIAIVMASWVLCFIIIRLT
ncbi:hypothetical protein OC834_005290 [Tilletia horrida]|nr:hypothetical protein OC834_005290 [Tilletia horrida]